MITKTINVNVELLQWMLSYIQNVPGPSRAWSDPLAAQLDKLLVAHMEVEKQKQQSSVAESLVVASQNN